MMMTDKNDLHDETLEAMLADMSGAEPAPSEGLLLRIMADADGVVSEPLGSTRMAGRDVSIWTELRNALGGWTALAGLGTATIAGVWIGIVSPTSVTGVTDRLLPVITSEELSISTPDFDQLVDEG